MFDLYKKLIQKSENNAVYVTKNPSKLGAVLNRVIYFNEILLLKKIKKILYIFIDQCRIIYLYICY